MTTAKPTHLRWGLLCFVVFVYALAFFLPAVSLPGRMGPIRIGDEVIAEGGEMIPPARLKGHQAFYWAMDMGRADWFANPVLWVGFVLLACRQWLLCGIAGAIALVLGMLSFLVYDSPDAEMRATFFVGYWAWLTSMLALSAIGSVGCFLSIRHKHGLR